MNKWTLFIGAMGLCALATIPLRNTGAISNVPEENLELVDGPIMNMDGPFPQRPGNSTTIPSDRQGIETSLQGQYPIHMPDYKGVEQLLLLSDRWVVVVTSNLEEVSKELQALSAADPQFQHTDFLEAQAKWNKSRGTSYLDWTLFRNYIEPVIAKYIIQARDNAGERLMDNPDYYDIQSETDTHYTSLRQPSRVTRFIVSRGGERVAGFDPDYAQYSYLELPEPMVDGNRYSITLKNNKSVTFLYDEKRSVARTIKVNQVGYLPDVVSKYAYLGGYLFEFGPLDFSHLSGKPFQAINADTGQIAMTGLVELREANPRFSSNELMTGEDVYQLDISSLKTPGVYFLSVPGVGRSWPFKVSKDIYGDAFYNAMRGMFAQRCGIALTEPYSAWTREQCHHIPAYESEAVATNSEMHAPGFEPFDVIGATIDYSRSTPGPAFGWHDAADWDKNTAHYVPLLAMLTLYEISPNKFRDGQLHLPHLLELGVGGSGDGIPDLLNEAEFGLKIWSKGLSKEGGGTGFWETWTHPGINDPNVHYAFGVRMQWLSLLYATAAAQFAHLVKPFDAEKAALYEAEARKAYHYGTAKEFFKKTFVMHAKTNRGFGEPYTITVEDKEEYHLPYLASAQLRLYILTKEAQYLEGLEQVLLEAISKIAGPDTPSAYTNYTPFLYYGVFSPDADGKLSKQLKAGLTQIYRNYGQWLTRQSDQDPYRRAKERRDQELAWGWGVVTNRAQWMLISNHLLPDPAIRDAAVFNADYQMGTNPQGMMWTTGIGFVYPIHLQHAISEMDQILDPFPGIQLYGPTGSGWRMISQIWNPKNAQEKPWVNPEGKPIIFLPAGNIEGDFIKLPPMLRRYATHPNFLVDQNEFTIAETLAGNLFTYGMLMNDDWMPNEELKQRKPRADHLLFGYWYLP